MSKELKELRVLIVDERPYTLAHLKNRLEEEIPKDQILIRRSLRTAYEALQKEAFDMVIIDLCIPPVPEGPLQEYREKFFRRLSLNHGQTLGMWLSDHKPDTAYVYLSAVPDQLDRRPPSQKGAPLFGKEYDAERFPQRLYELWQDHQAGRRHSYAT